MKHLNKNQKVAVAVSLLVLGYLFFSESIMNFFNPSSVSGEQQSSELVIEEVLAGTGELAESGDIVSVHYVGTLQDGAVFDSSVSRGTPISFTLGTGQVIRGWDEGLVGMRVGGRRTLTIPPDYAYGPQGYGPIPPNATLTFQVELVDVAKPE